VRISGDFLGNLRGSHSANLARGYFGLLGLAAPCPLYVVFARIDRYETVAIVNFPVTLKCG
jgi:hypothetical protein